MTAKTITIFSCICGLLATFLRYLDLSLSNDSILLEQNFQLSTISIIICFIPSFVWFLFSRRKKRVGKVINDDKNEIFGYVSFLMGFISLYCSYNFWHDYLNEINLNLQDISIVGFSLSKPFAIITFIMAIYLISSGLIHLLKDNKIFEKLKIFELIPVFFGILLILYMYVHYSTALLISENIFAIVGSCSLLLALLNKGKFLSKTDENLKSYNQTVFFTILSCTLNGVYFYSNAFLNIVKSSELSQVPVLLQFLILSLSIYLLVFTLTAKSDIVKIVTSKPDNELRFKQN
ncbi:MAG: hypothetical protein R3Y35_08540 [Clostridia bacterium]